MDSQLGATLVNGCSWSTSRFKNTTWRFLLDCMISFISLFAEAKMFQGKSLFTPIGRNDGTLTSFPMKWSILSILQIGSSPIKKKTLIFCVEVQEVLIFIVFFLNLVCLIMGQELTICNHPLLF